MLAQSPLGIPWEEWFSHFKPGFITFGENHGDKFWVDILTVPVFSAIAGVLTNWTGVLMLFVPVKFTGFYLPGVKAIYPFLPRKVQVLPVWAPGGVVGFQGFIPARAEKMACIVYDLAIAKIGSLKDLIGQMDLDAIEKQIVTVARPQLRPLTEEIMSREQPALWKDVPPQIKEAVYDRIEQEVPAMAARAFDRIRDNVDHLVDARLLVVGFLRRNQDVLKDLVQGLGAPELRFMVRVGLLGFPFGIVLACYLAVHQKIPVWGEFVPSWVVVLLGAALIGIIAVSYTHLTLPTKRIV